MRSIVNLTMVVTAGALGLMALASCGPRGNKPNVELIQDMMESPAIDAQEYDAGSPHNRGMRVPPENTVPQGFEPYAYATDIEAASSKLKNPLAGQMEKDILVVGQRYYNTQCAVCHGFKGEGGVEGKMPVSEKMALKPPTLLSDKVRGWTDGRLYHVITMGQGVMGPYAAHVPQSVRWQVVNYIRFLEKQAGK